MRSNPKLSAQSVGTAEGIQKNEKEAPTAGILSDFHPMAAKQKEDLKRIKIMTMLSSKKSHKFCDSKLFICHLIGTQTESRLVAVEVLYLEFTRPTTKQVRVVLLP